MPTKKSFILNSVQKFVTHGCRKYSHRKFRLVKPEVNARETFEYQRAQGPSHVKALATDTTRAQGLPALCRQQMLLTLTCLTHQVQASQSEAGNPSIGTQTPVSLQDQGQYKQTPPCDDFNFTVEQKQQFLQKPPFSSKSQLVPRLAICSLIMSPGWWSMPTPPADSSTPRKQSSKIACRGQRTTFKSCFFPSTI